MKTPFKFFILKFYKFNNVTTENKEQIDIAAKENSQTH